MTLPVMIAFDLSLPLIASQAFTAAGKAYADGDPVDWRAIGLNDVEIHAWWRAGLVRHPMSSETMQRLCNHVEYDAKVTAGPASKQRARR